jgi:hypothetical protein
MGRCLCYTTALLRRTDLLTCFIYPDNDIMIPNLCWHVGFYEKVLTVVHVKFIQIHVGIRQVKLLGVLLVHAIQL